MAKWKLTIRDGPQVSRRGFDDLDSVLAAARKAAREALDEPTLDQVKAFRDYAPAQRTKVRVEVAGKGFLRPPTAGIDVRGDNSMVGFTGLVRRRKLRAEGLDDILLAVRDALQGG